MLSSGIISDENKDLSDISDDINVNSELQIKELGKNELNDIFFESNLNYNISIKSQSKSGNKSVDENYLKKKEQINEIKINIFYILSLDFQFIRDFSSSYYILFPKCENEVKAKRLVIQKFYLDNKKIIYKDKEYIFIPIQTTSPVVTFKYNKDIITYKKDKTNNNKNEIKFNDVPLLTMEQFLDQFSEPEIKDIIKKNESTENVEDKSTEDKKSKKSNKSKDISINSKSSNLSHMTTSDDSEKETRGERFYKINKKNDYIRFFFTNYVKEIYGVYNKHKTIHLNIEKKIDLTQGLSNLKDKYDNNNDLKCGIIFKNFDEAIIDKDEPIIIEVKKGFRLIDLFNQIKQNSKIFSNFSGIEKIKMPKYAIGIICSNFDEDYQEQIDNLNKNYKLDQNITYLAHINNIINKNNFNIVIGVFKQPKILDYPIDIEDYNIKGENLFKRVDIEFMNKATGVNKDKIQIQKILKNISSKYKSLTYIKPESFDKLYQTIQDQEKIIKAKDKLLEEKEILLNKEKQSNNDMMSKIKEAMHNKTKEELFKFLQEQFGEIEKKNNNK
jgi:hypothetical protein